MTQQTTAASPAKTIAVTGFIAGSLDILAAIIVYAVIQEKTTAENILRYIASAVFGNKAFTGGTGMIFAGLLFHYLVAYIFTAIYVLLYPRISFLRKQKLLSGIAYGILVWFIMNVIVVPTAFSKPYSFTSFESLFTAMIILILMIGIPIAFLTGYFYMPAPAAKT